MQNAALGTATGCTQDTNIHHLQDEILTFSIHEHLELYASHYKHKTQPQSHLFNCTHRRTTLSPIDLWKIPTGVMELLPDVRRSWLVDIEQEDLTPPTSKGQGSGDTIQIDYYSDAWCCCSCIAQTTNRAVHYPNSRSHKYATHCNRNLQQP